MNYNFVRVGAANIIGKVGNISHNTAEIKKTLKEADKKNIHILVFPELSLSSYTCADMFNQSTLLNACKKALIELCNFSQTINTHFIVGSPLAVDSVLYNLGFLIGNGKIIGAIPKINIPNYNEFYEKRWFSSGKDVDKLIKLTDDIVFRLNPKQVFSHHSFPFFDIGIEICEDLWSMYPPSINLAKNGAKIIFNLSASNEITGKNKYRMELIKTNSAKTFSGYVYASAGFGESSTDLVFGGKLAIAENGNIINENERFKTKSELIYSDIDLEKLNHERMNYTSLFGAKSDCIRTTFNVQISDYKPELNINPLPFIPNEKEMDERCKEILNIQSFGLAKRIQHIGIKKAVVGVSGGLDSTLAVIATYKAFSILGLDKKGIIAITMPGFGTSDRTYENAVKLIKDLGLTFKEISVKEASLQHFKDIGQDPKKKDVVYENSQARERTQILMDIANMERALVIGTGDLSELALGFATYNGDHMSMYGVNASIPKTLVRYLIKWASAQNEFKKVSKILADVGNTPVSPELLPPDEKGNIAQVTEDIIGPYELHDFFLYQLIKNGFSPEKILFLACKAFNGKYNEKTIKKWLEIFIKRFFSSQFKRSCMPDGPKVGSVCLSPRGDFRMPSDFDRELWLN